MNRKQKVILSLLKEIDEICRKNNIEYYLSPRLTLWAVENDPREKRALESMKTHKYFPGFYLRYENTDTVCLNLDCPREYAYPGLGITIYPLRANGDSGMKKRWSTFEEKGWLENIDQPADEKGFKTFCSKMLIKLRCQLTGRQWTADEMGEVGRRVLNIGRAFNQREGFNRAHDTIPKRLVKDALGGEGPAAGQKIPQEAFEDMLDQYYEVMGWDKNGMMPEELIQSIL